MHIPLSREPAVKNDQNTHSKCLNPMNIKMLVLSQVRHVDMLRVKITSLFVTDTEKIFTAWAPLESSAEDQPQDTLKTYTSESRRKGGLLGGDPLLAAVVTSAPSPREPAPVWSVAALLQVWD